jgi:hypothetical protein
MASRTRHSSTRRRGFGGVGRASRSTMLVSLGRFAHQTRSEARAGMSRTLPDYLSLLKRLWARGKVQAAWRLSVRTILSVIASGG